MKAYIITLISVLVAVANPIAVQHDEIGLPIPEAEPILEKAKPLKAVESLETLSAVNTTPETPKPTVAPSTQGSCEDWLRQAGIQPSYAVNKLIIKESGCDPGAVNPVTAACGIAQELLEPNQRGVQWASVNSGVCPKSKCSMSDPVCQLKWMDNYVKLRYGSWEQALNFHNMNNWY